MFALGIEMALYSQMRARSSLKRDGALPLPVLASGITAPLRVGVGRLAHPTSAPAPGAGALQRDLRGDLVERARGHDARPVRAPRGREPAHGEPDTSTRSAPKPVGWLVTGYPVAEIDTPAHTAFRDAFEAKWHEPPKLGAVVGYAMIHSIAAMLDKAGSTDTDKMIEAMADLQVDTPSARSPGGRSTTSRPWAPSSAGSRSRTATAR